MQHPPHGSPCAFHEGFMAQIRDAIVSLKEQMALGMKAVEAQSRANGEVLGKLAESQVVRRELCARQEQRIGGLELAEARHREDHQKARDEYVEECDDLWTQLNLLKKIVYIGLGVAVVLNILAPILLKTWLESALKVAH